MRKDKQTLVNLAEDDDAREARFRVVWNLRVEEEDAFVRKGVSIYRDESPAEERLGKGVMNEEGKGEKFTHRAILAVGRCGHVDVGFGDEHFGC